jgi:hypothetical protein
MIPDIYVEDLDQITRKERFFEAAQLDLAAAKAMTERDLYQSAIYHLQEA